MEEQTIVSLLNQISAINKKYEKIAEITGENFNIFRILKVEASEVGTHSVLLGELLNPKGTHGQGDTFLKLFIDKFQFKGNSFDTKSGLVEIEKFTGFINEDYSEGGRIDIMITDKHKNQIIIENKIYAYDQKKQLLRYHKNGENADLFYLTLNGDEPSADSTNQILEKDKHFKTLSYKTDILEWLNLCKKEAVNHPILRETITQYINIIKYLTNKTINEEMKKEMVNLITKDEANFKSAFEINREMENAKKILIEKLIEGLRVLVTDKGWKFEVAGDTKDWGVYVTPTTWNNYKLYLWFELAWYNNCYYGIEKIKDNEKTNALIKEKLRYDDDGMNIYQYFNPRNWSNDVDVWVKIINGNTQKDIMLIFESIFSKLEGIKGL